MAEGADVPRGRTGGRAGGRVGGIGMLQESRERCFSRATALAPASRSSCRHAKRDGCSRERSAARDALVRAAQFFPPIPPGPERAARGTSARRFRSSPLLTLSPSRRARGAFSRLEQPPVPVVALPRQRRYAAGAYAPSRQGAGRRRTARRAPVNVRRRAVARLASRPAAAESAVAREDLVLVRASAGS